MCNENMVYRSNPQPFWHQGAVSWKTIFPWTGVGGGRGRRQSSGGGASELALSTDWEEGGLGPLIYRGE